MASHETYLSLVTVRGRAVNNEMTGQERHPRHKPGQRVSGRFLNVMVISSIFLTSRSRYDLGRLENHQYLATEIIKTTYCPVFGDIPQDLDDLVRQLAATNDPFSTVTSITLEN